MYLFVLDDTKYKKKFYPCATFPSPSNGTKSQDLRHDKAKKGSKTQTK